MAYEPTIYRVSDPMRRVLQLFLDQPTHGGRLYGYEIQQATHLQSGSLYPMLHRLHNARWLLISYESWTPMENPGRPARVYYKLSDLGREQAMRVSPPPPIEELASLDSV